MRRGKLGRVAQPSQEKLKTEGHACGWYMQRYSQTEKKWQDQYFFREVENTPGDFDVMNWVVATNPAKGFYHVRSPHDPFACKVCVNQDGILTVSCCHA